MSVFDAVSCCIQSEACGQATSFHVSQKRATITSFSPKWRNCCVQTFQAVMQKKNRNVAFRNVKVKFSVYNSRTLWFYFVYCVNANLVFFASAYYCHILAHQNVQLGLFEIAIYKYFYYLQIIFQ